MHNKHKWLPTWAASCAGAPSCDPHVRPYLNQLRKAYKDMCGILGTTTTTKTKRLPFHPRFHPETNQITLDGTSIFFAHIDNHPVGIYTMLSNPQTFEHALDLAIRKDYQGIRELFDLDNIAYAVIYADHIEIPLHYSAFYRFRNVITVAIKVFAERIELHAVFLHIAIDHQAFGKTQHFPIYDRRGFVHAASAPPAPSTPHASKAFTSPFAMYATTTLPPQHGSTTTDGGCA